MSGLPTNTVAPASASQAFAVVAAASNEPASQAPEQPFARVLQDKVAKAPNTPSNDVAKTKQSSDSTANNADAAATEVNTTAEAGATTATTAEATTQAIDTLATLLPWMLHNNPQNATALLAAKGQGTATEGKDSTTPVINTEAAKGPALPAQLILTTDSTQTKGVVGNAAGAANEQMDSALGGNGNNRPAYLPQAASTAANVAVTTETTALQAAADTPQQQAGFEAILASAANTAAAKVTNAPTQQPAAAHIDAPLGTQAWNNQVGERISWMSNQQQSTAELVLNPQHLGKIEVSLSINGDQATASFVSANPQVREALENAMSRLREVLADSGISLGQTHVGAESSGDTAQNQQNGDNRSRNGAEGSVVTDGSGADAGQSMLRSLRQGTGMLDVFA